MVTTKEVFPRTQRVEVATAGGVVKTALSLGDNNLVLQDEHTAVATLDPLKAFGQSAFGPLAMRPVAADGTTTAPTVRDLLEPGMVTVHSDDTLRHVSYVFAEHAITQAPVLKDGDPRQLLGVISLRDLLHARLYDLTEEHHRERHLGPRPRAGRPAV